MRYSKLHINLGLACLCLLCACGRKKASSMELIQTSGPQKVISGQYLGVFQQVNQVFSGPFAGAFTFSKDIAEEDFVVDVRLTGGGAGVIHAQNVRTGWRCPTTADDQNQDGVIDALEGEAVYGKILIPLDGDLTTQAAHDGEFPIGDQYGNYLYERVASFNLFMDDLRGPIDENYVKLKSEESLVLEGLVVVVHGIDEKFPLPSTVYSTDGRSPHQALPIACGVIGKVIEIPGQVENE